VPLLRGSIQILFPFQPNVLSCRSGTALGKELSSGQPNEQNPHLRRLLDRRNSHHCCTFRIGFPLGCVFVFRPYVHHLGGFGFQEGPVVAFSKVMKSSSQRLLYIKVDDWTWWAWTITAGLLIVGLAGYDWAFIASMAVTAVQGIILLARERRLTAFPVQLRLAYLILLVICYPPPMRWLYWLPAVGTIALIIFGYCLLARFLSLLPWNSHETLTVARLRRTFLSAPDLGRVKSSPAAASCAGGLCTIEAQVAPAGPKST
jgi:hypothetical protein